jgi:hypothetical protein
VLVCVPPEQPEDALDEDFSGRSRHALHTREDRRSGAASSLPTADGWP